MDEVQNPNNSECYAYWTVDKNLVIFSVMHRRQNLLDLTSDLWGRVKIIKL
jgi:hypothetical protein